MELLMQYCCLTLRAGRQKKCVSPVEWLTQINLFGVTCILMFFVSKNSHIDLLI